FAGFIPTNSRKSWLSQWCAAWTNTWNGWPARPPFPSAERMSSFTSRVLLAVLLTAATLAYSAEPELLEPDKAFRFSARLKDARSIEVNYQIAPGYYLYREQFRFSAAPAEGTLGAPQFPPGTKKRDEFFGEVETYRGNLTILVPLQLAEPKVSAVTLTATSQGCADVGVCYIPHEQKARLQLASAGGAVAGAPPAPLAASERVRRGGDDTRIAAVFAGGFWFTVASFFGFGLLLSLTPCVLPMVPILSGIIVGGGR